MSFLYARASCAWFILAALCIAPAAQAQTVESPLGELTLAQAVAAALAGNPELRASVFELRASEGRLRQAGLRPNPELGVEFENFAGSGEASGSDVLETTLTLSHVIEFGDKRERRRRVASDGHQALAVERQIRQLDVLAEVKRRYLDVVLAQEHLALRQTALAVAEQTHSVMARRVRSARSPGAERSRAEIARTRSRLALARARQHLDASRVRLAAIWGEDQARFSTAVGELFVLPAVESIGPLAIRLAQSPHLLRYAAEERLHNAELELARARARPTLRLNAGLRRLEETDDTAVVAGVSLPLPLFDRGQGQRIESRSRIAQTAAQRSAALIELRATLSGLHGELLVATESVEILRSELLPLANAALDQTRAGFERGRFSYLELASAQQDVLDTERTAIDAAGTVHRLHTEIERLTGQPLAGPTP